MKKFAKTKIKMAIVTVALVCSGGVFASENPANGPRKNFNMPDQSLVQNIRVGAPCFYGNNTSEEDYLITEWVDAFKYAISSINNVGTSVHLFWSDDKCVSYKDIEIFAKSVDLNSQTWNFGDVGHALVGNSNGVGNKLVINLSTNTTNWLNSISEETKK
jgi:hypothetical protein